MKLTMKEKQKVTEKVSKRYQKVSKKERGRILDEFVEITGYNRAYASYLLNNWGKKVHTQLNGKRVIFVFGKRGKKRKYVRKKYYDKKVKGPLKKLWEISGMICGKLLVKFIRDNLDLLIGFEEIKVEKAEKEKLLKISSATIDRMLSEEKKKLELRARSNTKPGTLLKNSIPIRTFADWDEKRPGFFELDLVSHNGGNTRGEFAQTLDFTDINTCWTETEAVKNKAQVYVFNAIKKIRKRLPYDILGLDSDNGGEFINAELYRYCDKEEITFTRSRSNKKNDNCFVEQKNYSIVRKTVGYYRYEGKEEVDLLNEIYKRLRLVTNYFIPTMKLIEKQRIGAKVKRKYDKPRTPYERVLESEYVEESKKEELREIRKKLNPAQLRREIINLQEKLLKAVTVRKKRRAA